MIDVVYYNDETRCFRDGVVERFYWNQWRIVKITPDSTTGYSRFNINKIRIYHHRLIAFCFLGLDNIVGSTQKGADVIDHKDRNKLNNCVDNLRITNQSGNHYNRSNVKGYCWRAIPQKYQARIRVNYKFISLGYYATEDEARTAYLEGKRKYHLE